MLTQRRGEVLRFLVTEYIDTAVPVGSQTLVERHRLGVSPATVRHDMSNLEEEGFITRFHSSSGGVPLDKGYRYYLDTAQPQGALASQTLEALEQRLLQGERDLERWLEEAAEGLAEVVANIAIATTPRLGQSRLKRVELVRLQEYLVLLVMVLQGAVLRKEVLPVEEPVSQEQLVEVANRLNATLAGQTGADVQETPVAGTPLEGRIAQHVAQVLLHQDQQRAADLFLYGMKHLFRQPEFSGGPQLQQAVEVLEDRALLGEVFASLAEGETHILIGRENPQEALHGFSVVVCHYGAAGGPGGSIGVIGPMRMRYHPTLDAVRYASLLLSRFLADAPSG